MTWGKTLLSGKFPSTDHLGLALSSEREAKAGQPVAGGWRGAFESWCGDWKERSLSHCFKRRNYQSTFLCDQCGAINPHAKTPAHLLQYVYSDFQGRWRETLRNHASYLRETPICNYTPWLDVPGFDISRVCWDLAHTVLLGCGKDLVGSFLLDLVTWLVYLINTFLFIGVPKSLEIGLHKKWFPLRYPRLTFLSFNVYINLVWPNCNPFSGSIFVISIRLVGPSINVVTSSLVIWVWLSGIFAEIARSKNLRQPGIYIWLVEVRTMMPTAIQS